MGTYNLFIVSLIAVTYVHVTFGAPRHNNTGFGQFTLCTTDECVNAASEILAKLNRTVDPCNNFYKFACGGWLQNNRPNLSFPIIDFYSVLREKTENQLREILEGPDKANDTVSLLKAKRVYEQCMNTGDSKVIGTNNLSAIVNTFGGWPMVMSRHDWDKKNLTWQNVSAILQENGFDNGLYKIRIMIDNKMSNSHVIAITEPSFMYETLIMIQLNKTLSQKERYISYIVDIAKILIHEIDGTVEDKNLTQDALDIVNFEIELANILSNTIEEEMDRVYIPLTIQQLQEGYDKQHPGINGKINWYTTIQKVFASEGITIEPSEKLVQVYKYFIKWTPLFERTLSRTIVNYMQWTVIRDLFTYKKQPQASDAQPGRDSTKWKSCVKEINLKSAISYEYVKKYASNVNIQAIEEMATDIKIAIREQIRRSTWMDEPTREALLEKLAYMRHEFFQLDWYSDEAIDRYYENLNVSVEYLDNVININKFEKKKMMGLLRIPVNKKQWYLDQEPTEPKAYTRHDVNTIYFTAALLQDPVYNKSRLPLLNYGTLGVAIAHEMTHGFDNVLHNYNQDGKIQWTQKSIDEHKKIVQCFIDQYDNYLVPGLEDENVYVNGQLTVEENIDDSAGIVAAYYAYKNRKTRLNETEWRMQGLDDYSDDQIFFLTYAQMNCETALRENRANQYAWILKPGKEIKIRGSLSNSREFSEVYNCSSGTPMNPENKCAFWY